MYQRFTFQQFWYQKLLVSNLIKICRFFKILSKKAANIKQKQFYLSSIKCIRLQDINYSVTEVVLHAQPKQEDMNWKVLTSDIDWLTLAWKNNDIDFL
jgi:hypothetical protein